MPSYPANTPWEEFDGGYTVANSPTGRVLTLPATIVQPLRGKWRPGVIARHTRVGTAAGTVLGRSSLVEPGSRNDDTPIRAAQAEMTHFYDGASNTLPTASAAWNVGGAGTVTPSVSGLRIETTAGQNVFWYRDPASWSSAKLLQVSFGFQINPAHDGDFDIWSAFPFAAGRNLVQMSVTGAAYGADAYRFKVGGAYYGAPMALSTTYVGQLICRSADATNVAEIGLWSGLTNVLDGVQSLSGMVKLAGLLGTNFGAQNYIYFGDAGTALVCDVTLMWISAFQAPVACDEFGFENLTNPDTTFARNAGFWQTKAGTLANGTVTSLVDELSATVPAAPATVAATALGADKLVFDWTAVAGCTYVARLYTDLNVLTLTTSGIPADRLDSCFAVPSAGDWYVTVESISADNVACAAATASSTVTLPAVTGGTNPPSVPVVRFPSGPARPEVRLP